MKTQVRYQWTLKNKDSSSIRVWSLTKLTEKEFERVETETIAVIDEFANGSWNIFLKSENDYRKKSYSTCWEAMEVVHLILGIE